MKKEISTHISENQERCAVVSLNNDTAQYEVTYIDRANSSVVTQYYNTLNEAEDVAEDWALNE
jgi:hypothetical protein